ncbi:MAG: hypothetical protein P4L10_03020 [Acidobacteriaceae bacterium]|nr:hypothetical protein [Acidobacteriaceae bacterium]
MTRLHLSATLLPAAAMVFLIAAPASAQTERATGVSHPDTVTVAEMNPAPAPSPVAPKPSAAQTSDPAIIPHTAILDAAPDPDPDANIVTYVPAGPNELPVGTLIKVRMSQTISSKSTLVGTPFTATIEDPIERDGKVIVPAGSELHGTVEDVHGGARIFGRSSLRLKTEYILLPDGSHYVVHAQVIDTDQFRNSQIGRDGEVIGSDHAKRTLAVASLTTGSAAAAGAVFGGVPGALIGAGVGAGVSTAQWLRHDRQMVLPVESKVTFSLTTSMPMTPLR